MGDFIKDLTECYNNDGTMMFSYSNSVITIYDEIDFSDEETGSIGDMVNGEIQILYGDKSIWISPDKLQYDLDDELYTYHDVGTDVTISFMD